MSELTERLRKLVIMDEVGSDNPLGRDAADEIERLQGLVEEMEELIRDIQKLAGDKFPISPEAIDRRLTASEAKSDKE